MTNDHQIMIGDCIDMMRRLPAQSVQTCVTSPPYFGLRDYGMEGQIGLEETPTEFIARLVEAFREVHRVLRDDGTLWLNMGDSYASKPNGPLSTGGRKVPHNCVRTAHARRSSKLHDGFKHKDMMGIPWRLAFALQDDGWYLRQDIIWHKPNPMPESTRDRCTKAHEYIFLLSKSPSYHCDMQAIKEPAAESSAARWAQDIEAQAGSDRVPGKTNGPMKAVGGVRSRRDSFQRDNSKREQAIPGQSKGTHLADRIESEWDAASRNKLSVWTVPTRGYKGAHFATFPPDLIRPCVLAGAPRGGLVLDPFGGAGTTALVSMQEGRRSIICELNPDYAAIAKHRLEAALANGASQMDILLDTKESA
ncbi:DNA methylase N-4/N-6 [Pseudomonas cichorii]|uniref:Methyltransferase n=1 Tax=Pseudomonas cichorii TaxID=36746 RepID=A0A3M4LWV3_PSECI|nr:site-specific DNA-methyltransferase [Pseudomonas cichorii]RMQ45949.1 DNA methylase N-4/N-6 [Pseudomonas cichorii]